MQDAKEMVLVLLIVVKARLLKVWKFGEHNKIVYALIRNKIIASSALFLANNRVDTASFDCTVFIITFL